MADDEIPKSLCPVYKKALTEMQNSLKFSETDEQKLEILKKFSEKYLMIPKYWQMLLSLNAPKGGLYTKSIRDWEYRYNLCFYSIDKWQHREPEWIHASHIKWNTLKKFHNCVGETPPGNHICRNKQLKELLKFPHQHLTTIFELLKHFGASPVSFEIKQTYAKSLKLYNRFVKAGDDDEKWLKCLNELEDDEAVMANIELRLGEGQHYANQAIWKYYINFLKNKKSSVDLLNLYRRYCRLFVSDNEAMGEYLNLSFKNVLDGKTNDGFKEPLWKISQKWRYRPKWWSSSQNNVLPKQVPPKIYFKDCTKSIKQTMPFHSSFSYYIITTAKGTLLHKLHKSCKYFFHQRPYPVCHRLVVTSWLSRDDFYDNKWPYYYDEQTLFIQANAFSRFQNLYISQDFVLGDYADDATKFLTANGYKFEASNIWISSVKNVDMKGFKLFIKSGTVKSMNLYDVNIIDEKGQPLNNEQIKKLLEFYENKCECNICDF